MQQQNFHFNINSSVAPIPMSPHLMQMPPKMFHLPPPPPPIPHPPSLLQQQFFPALQSQQIPPPLHYYQQPKALPSLLSASSSSVSVTNRNANFVLPPPSFAADQPKIINEHQVANRPCRQLLNLNMENEQRSRRQHGEVKDLQTKFNSLRQEHKIATNKWIERELQLIEKNKLISSLQSELTQTRKEITAAEKKSKKYQELKNALERWDVLKSDTDMYRQEMLTKEKNQALKDQEKLFQAEQVRIGLEQKEMLQQLSSAREENKRLKVHLDNAKKKNAEKLTLLEEKVSKNEQQQAIIEKEKQQLRQQNQQLNEQFIEAQQQIERMEKVQQERTAINENRLKQSERKCAIEKEVKEKILSELSNCYRIESAEKTKALEASLQQTKTTMGNQMKAQDQLIEHVIQILQERHKPGQTQPQQKQEQLEQQPNARMPFVSQQNVNATTATMFLNVFEQSGSSQDSANTSTPSSTTQGTSEIDSGIAGDYVEVVNEIFRDYKWLPHMKLEGHDMEEQHQRAWPLLTLMDDEEADNGQKQQGNRYRMKKPKAEPIEHFQRQQQPQQQLELMRQESTTNYGWQFPRKLLRERKREINYAGMDSTLKKRVKKHRGG